MSANGEASAALREIMVARRLDPQSTAILADYGYVLYLTGHALQGVRILRDVQTAAPRSSSPHTYMAQFALEAGDGALYLQEAALSTALRGDASGQAEVEAARRAFARDGMDGLLRACFDATPAQRHYQRAGLAALMGKPALALSLLAEAKARRDPNLITIAGDPAFVAMRKDARFAAYFRRPSLQS